MTAGSRGTLENFSVTNRQLTKCLKTPETSRFPGFFFMSEADMVLPNLTKSDISKFISRKLKRFNISGSEQSGLFLHIISKKLTRNLIGYSLFVGYNIDR